MKNESYEAIDSKYLNKTDDKYHLSEKTDEELCLIGQERVDGVLSELANEARNFMIARSKKFIESEVRAICLKFSGNVEFDEEVMYQAGRIGLNNAIDEYDPATAEAKARERGTDVSSFRTYASYFVVKELYAEVDNYFDKVRIPENIKRCERKINKLRNENPELTDNEIMKKAIRNGIVKDSKEYRYVNLICDLRNIRCLDEAYDEEGKVTLGDISCPIGSDGRIDSMDSVETADMIYSISKLLDSLPDYQKKAIRLLYGLNAEGRNYSIEEVRNELGLTTRAVEHAVEEAFKSLRVESLRIFLE